MVGIDAGRVARRDGSSEGARGRSTKLGHWSFIHITRPFMRFANRSAFMLSTHFLSFSKTFSPLFPANGRNRLLDSCSSSSSTVSSTRLLFSRLNECTQTIRWAVERRAIFFVLSHRTYQINCDEPVSLQVFLIFFATTFHSFVISLSRNSYNYVSRCLFAIAAEVSKQKGRTTNLIVPHLRSWNSYGILT